MDYSFFEGIQEASRFFQPRSRGLRRFTNAEVGSDSYRVRNWHYAQNSMSEHCTPHQTWSAVWFFCLKINKITFETKI